MTLIRLAGCTDTRQLLAISFDYVVDVEAFMFVFVYRRIKMTDDRTRDGPSEMFVFMILFFSVQIHFYKNASTISASPT